MATIRLVPDGTEVACGVDQPLLDALEHAGYVLPSDCRSGHCGTCKVRLAAGDIDRGLYMPMALSEEEVGAGYALACITTPVDELIELCYEPPEQPLFASRRNVEHVVLDKVTRTPEIVELRLLPTEERLRYRPGQHVTITADGTGESRPYSIANAPRPDGEITLYVARAAGGRVSSWIHDDVQPGRRLHASGPYGTFVGNPDGRGPVLCLASGSGLAPILALTDAALGRGYADPVTLLFSASTPDDLYALGRISYWQYLHPNFRFVRTITRPWPGISPPHGHVPDVLADLVGDLSDHLVFVAGSPGFVHACCDRARELGARADRIHVENYFGSTDV